MNAVKKSINVATPKVATLPLSTSYQRAFLIFRSFSASVSLGTFFTRFLTFARSHTTSVLFSTGGRVQIAFDILNRITGGSTTVYKRFIQIWED
jgi:hypothetical protein